MRGQQLQTAAEENTYIYNYMPLSDATLSGMLQSQTQYVIIARVTLLRARYNLISIILQIDLLKPDSGLFRL